MFSKSKNVMMERRHFELIARVLEEQKPSGWDDLEDAMWRRIVHNFADALAPTNPLFDRERFLKACGVTP